MDDLSQKLNDLLNSPDSMNKIRSALSAMGLDGDEGGKAAVPEASPAQTPDLSALLAGLTGGQTGISGEKPAGGQGSGLDLSMLAKLAPLLSGMGQEDENTALLRALRPYLHGDREKRLDDAIQIMKFMRVMPLLQDKGLLGG